MNYFAGSASYTTGGDQLNAEDVGLKWIVNMWACWAEDATQQWVPVFATGGEPVKSVKIMLFTIAGVEIGNGTNQSAKRYRVIAEGTY
jgi:hypothetical protein